MELLAALPTSAAGPTSRTSCGESDGESRDCDVAPVLTFCRMYTPGLKSCHYIQTEHSQKHYVHIQ